MLCPRVSYGLEIPSKLYELTLLVDRSPVHAYDCVMYILVLFAVRHLFGTRTRYAQSVWSG